MKLIWVRNQKGLETQKSSLLYHLRVLAKKSKSPLSAEELYTEMLGACDSSAFVVMLSFDNYLKLTGLAIARKISDAMVYIDQFYCSKPLDTTAFFLRFRSHVLEYFQCPKESLYFVTRRTPEAMQKRLKQAGCDYKIYAYVFKEV